MYDRSYGGFGSGNKFPQPAYLELLLRSTFATGDSDAMEMLVETLNAMTPRRSTTISARLPPLCRGSAVAGAAL